MLLAEPELDSKGNIIIDEITGKPKIKQGTVRECFPISWVCPGSESKLQSLMLACQTDQIQIKAMGGKALHLPVYGNSGEAQFNREIILPIAECTKSADFNELKYLICDTNFSTNEEFKPGGNPFEIAEKAGLIKLQTINWLSNNRGKNDDFLDVIDDPNAEQLIQFMKDVDMMSTVCISVLDHTAIKNYIICLI